MSLKVSVATGDFTPQRGLPLLGNFRGNDYAAKGIHDPLYANAIVFESSEGKKVALLSVKKTGTAGLLKKSSFLTKSFIKLPLNVHFQIFFANRKYQNNLL